MAPIENDSRFGHIPSELTGGVDVLNYLRWLEGQKRVSYSPSGMVLDSGGRLTLADLEKLCPDFSVLFGRSSKYVPTNPLAGLGFKYCDMIPAFERTGTSCEGHRDYPIFSPSKIDHVDLYVAGLEGVALDGEMFFLSARRGKYVSGGLLDMQVVTVAGKREIGYVEALKELSFAKGKEKTAKRAIVGLCLMPKRELELLRVNRLHRGFYFKVGKNVYPFLMREMTGGSKMVVKASEEDLQTVGGESGVKGALQQMYGIEIK